MLRATIKSQHIVQNYMLRFSGGPMDREYIYIYNKSACGVLDCTHLFLLPPWGNGYDLVASFRKNKNPHSDPALCGILGVSFYLYNNNYFLIWIFHIISCGAACYAPVPKYTIK